VALTDDLRSVSAAFKTDVTSVFKGHRRDAEDAVRVGSDAARAFETAKNEVHALIEGKQFNGRPIVAENLKLNLGTMAAAIAQADKDIPDPGRFEKFMLRFERLERAAPKQAWRAFESAKKAKHDRAIEEFTVAMEKYAQKVRTNRHLKDAWKAFQKKTRWKVFAAAGWASSKLDIQKARGDFAHYASALAQLEARHTITVAQLNQIRASLKAMKSAYIATSESNNRLSAIGLDLYNIDSIVLSQVGQDLSDQLREAAEADDSDQAEAKRLHSEYRAFVQSYVDDSEATRMLAISASPDTMEDAYTELMGTSPAQPPMDRIDEAGRIRSTHRIGRGGQPLPPLTEPEATPDDRRRDDARFEREIVAEYRSKRRQLKRVLGGPLDTSSSPHRSYLSDTNGDGEVLAPFDSFITNVRDAAQAIEGAARGVKAAIDAASAEAQPEERTQAQIAAFNAYHDFLDELERVEGELSQLAVSLRSQQTRAASRDMPEEMVDNYGGFIEYVRDCQDAVSGLR